MKKKIKDLTPKEADQLREKLCFKRCLKKKNPCVGCPYYEGTCLALFIGIGSNIYLSDFQEKLWEIEIDTDDNILTNNQRTRLKRLMDRKIYIGR